MNDAVINLEAEQAVLGSMLIDEDCIHSVLPKLREEDFYFEHYRQIWSTIQSMDARGKHIDALTVAAEFGDAKEWRELLAQLMEVTPTSANVLEYVEIVAACGKRRKLRTALQDALTAIDERQPDDVVFPHVEAAIEAYDDRSRDGVDSPVEQNKAFFAHRDRIDRGNPPFTRTGFQTLDRMLGGGLLDGNLYYLAARPGTGKTGLALNIGDYVAAHIGPVLFASMEMSSAEVMSRRLAMQTGIDSQRLLMKPLTEQEYDAVATASVKLSSVPLRMVSGGSLSVQQVSSIARSMRDIRLILIDHFTLFNRPHRQQDFAEYAELSHRLKNLARRLNVPILCLIQVSRDDGLRKKRSRLDTLRGSGATEEDAAGVLFIENAADAESDGNPREEYVILEKNRFGPTGTITMSFRPKSNVFVESVDSKAVVRKYVEDGKAAKERNHREAMELQQTYEDLEETGDEPF